MITSAAMPPYNHEQSGKQDSASAQQASSTLTSRSTSMTQQEGSLSAASVSPIPTHNQSPPEMQYNPHSFNSSGPTPMSTEASAPRHSQQPYPDWTMSDASNVLQAGHSATRAAIQNKENRKKERQIAPAKKRQNAKIQHERPKSAAVTARRQKRLERNRESARLSRRRRKQYLEVLEERVTHLSVEMDQGRREHAGVAMETVIKKRKEAILNTGDPIEAMLTKLDGGLNRTSSELSVLSTFYIQQLKSLSLPPHSTFILWLTLQGDSYFRGGRAASERLSAARIGERMLLGGNDKVAPINSMWPLVCNEIGLSYDQEERVRNFQRTLLQTPSTWLDRHTSRAAGLVADAFDSSLKTVTQSIRNREQNVAKELRPEQRMKFARWAEQNTERIKNSLDSKRSELAKNEGAQDYEVSTSHHTSANLYILNHRLRHAAHALPKESISFNAATLKRLSRRPSFESLGQQKEDAGGGLTREGSFASSGSLKSLKRSSSSLSIDDPDRPHSHQIHPEDGQREAEPLVKKELGFVQAIIPPPVMSTTQSKAVPIPLPPPPAPGHHKTYMAPKLLNAENTNAESQYQQSQRLQYPSTVPTLQVSMHTPQYSVATSHHNQQHQQQQLFQQPQHAQPAASDTVNVPASHQGQQTEPLHPESSRPAKVHKRKTSFLPAHLSAVPEEEFNAADGGAEDFFMSLIDDEDWAIGEGVDMDPTS